MDRKIIVFGATGNSGIEICKSLLKKNLEYSVFIRKGSESKLKTKPVDIIYGNVLDINEVKNALLDKNYTDIIIALGSRDLKGVPVRSTGTKNIIDSLTGSSLRGKLHVISAHGIGNSWNKLSWFEKLISKLLIGKTMKDHELQESYINNYSGQYHIIRPVALKDTAGTGKIIENNDAPLPNSDISREDVATFIVDGVLSNKVGVSSICKGN
jgi:nucleoside-diphosphate-sugar epimerase